MRKPVFHIGLFTFLLLPFFVKAQSEKNVMPDTLPVVMPVPGEEPVRPVLFDSAGPLQLVRVRHVPAPVVDSLKAADDFWYANAELVKRKVKAEPSATRQKSLFNERWFRNLIWFVILASFLAVVIWYLISSDILIFRKRSKKVFAEDGPAETTDDIFSLDYDKEISAATEEGNYRLAVRLWYLCTLKELSEKGLIDYRYGRTNQDYVSQLNRSLFYRDFFRLTRNFEYTWYGQFNLSAEAYGMMRHEFKTFQNALR